MSKKKYKPITETKVEKKRTTGEPPYKVLFYIACALVVVLFVIMVVPFGGSSGSRASSDEDIHELIGKSYVDLGRKAVATDIDDMSKKATYWTWTDQNGAWGYCTKLDIPGYPDVLMVVDLNIKIITMIADGPLGIGPKGQAEFEDVLVSYEGRSLLEFTYLETSIPEGDTAQFRGLLRDITAQALKILYVEVNGEQMFRSNFPQGIKFAKVGTKLEPWSTKLYKGGTADSDDYRGRKYAFLSTSSCGSCRNTVINISQRLQNEGGLSTDQIFIIFTSQEEKIHYIEKQMSGENLIHDLSQRKFSREIFLTEASPCMMLVDGNGVVTAKAGSRLLNDDDSLNEILQQFFSAP